MDSSPLVFPAIFFILGIVSSNFIQTNNLTILLISFVLLAMSLFKRIRIYCILLLFLVVGFLRISVFQVNPQNHIEYIFRNNPEFSQKIEGKITSEVTKKDNKYRFTTELLKIDSIYVTGKVNFITNQTDLKYGDIISTVVSAKKMNRTTNPSSFDYQEYMNSKGIFGFAFPQTTIRVIGSEPSIYFRNVFRLRKLMRKRIYDRFGKNAAFVNAVVLGDKRDLGVLRAELNKAGLSHILAVSGLHVGILSVALFLVLKMLIRNRNLSRILLISLLVIYGEICAWSPSVSRSVIMLSLYLMAKMMQRKPNANNILAISLFIILSIQPHQIFSAGFQMSFTAVFVLLNIIPKIKFIKTNKEDIAILSSGKKILNTILILVLSSFFLSIFLAPITLYHFNSFNINGIVGNIIGIPVISLLLPLSFIIILLPPIPILISLYSGSFRLLYLLFTFWKNMTVQVPLHFDFVRFNLFQVILCYSFLGLLILVFKTKNREKKIYLFGFALVLLISVFYINQSKSDQLKLTFFDCGLGDMALIETPNNTKILVDTGPTEKSSGHFAKSALPYFLSNGIEDLDFVFITHSHDDHYGGIFSVFDELNVRNFVVTDEFQTHSIHKNILPYIKKENSRIITISDTTHFDIGDVKITIIHPDEDYSDSNKNNMSIVFKLEYFDFSVLYTGDLEEEGEKYISEKYHPDADVLKVCHHGSKTSSSNIFLKEVSPDYVFIPAPLKNKFNFPHNVTIEKLEDLGENLFSAGKDGALQITTDGKQATFSTILSEKNIIDRNLN